ncbi:long-chain-fatty-acid--CoA ligase 3 [Ixodes scapularis]|uniref:long-chain-fatty-acid--CoA ligase 3 n=1 Tax=Ixodes scapularis TaxID=6945 RepID=UPI001A9E65CB|nr:long-chain-fatty-acid--CoA ligase 3 [Ixodes scapularis]
MSEYGIATYLLITKILVTLYDILTLPVYIIVQRPWNYFIKKRQSFGLRLDDDDPGSPYVKADISRVDRIGDLRTMDELMRRAVLKYADRPCMGKRELLGEVEDKQNGGKVIKKLSLGQYQWLSYNEVDTKIDLVSRGFMSLGLRPQECLVILAETRQEWLIAAQACFRVNIRVAALSATSAEQDIIECINKLEATHLLTSCDHMPKVAKIISKMPHLTHVIYMENQGSELSVNLPERVFAFSFPEIEEKGKRADIELWGQTPTEDDIAVIMYTSGSTGVPKGVMITHRNLIATLRGFSASCPDFGQMADDAYIAYLSLSHILELVAECFSLSVGAKIGYSSALTLTDKSRGLQPGTVGGATLLKPAIVLLSPLILNRIRKNIMETVAGKGELFSRFFDYWLNYKTFWLGRGFNTPILNRVVFKEMRSLLGGQFRIIATSSAPLCMKNDVFVRACLDCCPVQVYGLIETANSGALRDVNDTNFGRIGSPSQGCYVKLVNWDEGRYYITDEPRPRGEIVVGGECVTLGYFKDEAATMRCFKEEGGIRWFYTGDIGEIYPDGTICVLDRKENIVRLQDGQYVSLGKIEMELKASPFIENMCVYGSSYHSYLVAFVVPNPTKLHTLAVQEGKGNLNFNQACRNPAIVRAFTNAVASYGLKANLEKKEIPLKVKLCEEDWQPDTGLVTTDYKIRRRNIQIFYQNDLDEMYGESETTFVR